MEAIDYQRFRRWLTGDPDRIRIAFRVYNPKRAKKGGARQVLDWISLVERVAEAERMI